MADFTIDVSRSKTSRINLGIQGENIIEHIIFDISGWIEEFGEGVAYIYAQRKGDENPYPVALDMDLDAGTATWTITDADTAVKGKGKAQLVFVSDDEDSITDVDVYSSSSTYSVGDYCLYGTQLYKCKTTIGTAEAWTPAHWDAVNEVKKTRVYATTVQASLVSTSSENPDAYETWLEVLGGYTARIEAAEDDIKAWVKAQINAIDFPVDDVQIDETSVVSDGVAEIPKATSNQFGVVEISAQSDAPGGYAEITNANGTIQLPFVTDTNGIVTPIRAKYLPEATTGGKGAMSAADKAKLDGIESGAEVNVQADWNQSDSTEDDYIKNKPVDATTSVGGLMSATDKSKLDALPGITTFQKNTGEDTHGAHSYLRVFWNSGQYAFLPNISGPEAAGTILPRYLPEATTTTNGAMSAADKAKLDGIESGAEVNVQADWGQSDSTEDDYIKNKPGNATAYTDGFFSAANKRKLDSIEYSADVTPGVATTTRMGLMSSSDKSKLNGIETGAEANVQSDWNQTDNTADDFIKNKPEIVQKPTYKQTFTAPSSSDIWIYRIPYSADYSFDDLINFRAYGVVTDENDVITAVKGMKYWYLGQSATANYCDYRFYLSSSVSSGDTIIVENMFTDEGTLMASH